MVKCQKICILRTYKKNKLDIELIGLKKSPFKYMTDSDVFILSSKWEGFGHVVVEALACGVPVLSTECPHGPAEILENEKYGWLVPNDNIEAMAEKMIDLIKNSHKIEEKSKLSKERSEDFAAGKIVKEYEKLLLN